MKYIDNMNNRKKFILHNLFLYIIFIKVTLLT